MYVHAPTPIQAKAFLGLTKEKAMKMDPKELRGHCDAFKVLPKAMIPGLKDCSPEMSKTLSMAVAVCGSSSGGVVEYAPTNVAQAWKNHFEAFGTQNLDKIMLDYTEVGCLEYVANIGRSDVWCSRTNI